MQGKKELTEKRSFTASVANKHPGDTLTEAFDYSYGCVNNDYSDYVCFLLYFTWVYNDKRDAFIEWQIDLLFFRAWF